MEVKSMDISKFATSYLSVNMGYGKKKMTHSKLIEILNEFGLQECICKKDEYIDELDLYNGKVIAVKDQLGYMRYYRNPDYFESKVIHQVDKIYLENNITKLTELLANLYKKRLHEFDKIKEHMGNVEALEKQIDVLKQLIAINETNELEIQQSQEKYQRKIYKNRKRKYL